MRQRNRKATPGVGPGAAIFSVVTVTFGAVARARCLYAGRRIK
jgi:hypothetical protein